jgi:hypothetical protein
LPTMIHFHSASRLISLLLSCLRMCDDFNHRRVDKFVCEVREKEEDEIKSC